jgi:glycosyltransferase involved in cell wall biosynthesis
LGDRCEFHVACPREEPYWQRFIEVACASRMLPIPRRTAALLGMSRLRRHVLLNGIDIVHSHGHGAGILARLPTPRGTALVHTHHGLHFGADGSLLRRRLLVGVQRLLEARTACAIFVSEDESRAAVGMGLGRCRSRVIRNGVAMAPAPRRHAQTSGPLRIATVTRFNEQKNPRGLLAVAGALSGLPGGREAFVIDVYGDGEGRSGFEAELARSGLGSMFRLHGTVPGLAAALAGSDGYFSCSRWEGLPLAVLEAMAAGLPAVLSEVDGHLDILADGDRAATGYALDRPDVAAAALARLSDSALRADAGAAARACIARRYSLDTMLEQTFAAYCASLAITSTETNP